MPEANVEVQGQAEKVMKSTPKKYTKAVVTLAGFWEGRKQGKGTSAALLGKAILKLQLSNVGVATYKRKMLELWFAVVLGGGEGKWIGKDGSHLILGAGWHSGEWRE